MSVLTMHRCGLVLFIISLLTLHPLRVEDAAAQASKGICLPSHPLDVTVLVDNSTSMWAHDPHFDHHLHEWLLMLSRALRPGDKLRVATLPVVPRASRRILVERVVEPPSDPTYVRLLHEVAHGVRVINGERALHTDLTAALRALAGELGAVNRPPCPRILLAVTDGSLAPRDTMTRHEARNDFLAAVASLESSGVVIAFHLVGDAGVPAFDPEKRWTPSPLGSIPDTLSATELLRTVVSADGVIGWRPASVERFARHLFGNHLFLRHRGMAEFRGIPLDPPPFSYLMYLGGASGASDTLVNCEHESHYDHESVRHWVSRGFNEDVCLHHLDGSIPGIFQRLESADVKTFWWRQEGGLFTAHLPDTLRSLAEIVLSTSPSASCPGSGERKSRFLEPEMGEMERRFIVTITSPEAPTLREEVYLFAMADSACFAPAPSQRNLAQVAYSAPSLQLDVRSLGTAASGTTSIQLPARLAHLPWQEARWIRKIDLFRFLGDRWRFSGQVQVPTGARDPKVYFGGESRLLDRDTTCTAARDGLACFAITQVFKGSPPREGRIVFTVNAATQPREVAYAFARPERVKYGLITPVWISLGIAFFCVFSGLLLGRYQHGRVADSWTRFLATHAALRCTSTGLVFGSVVLLGIETWRWIEPGMPTGVFVQHVFDAIILAGVHVLAALTLAKIPLEKLIQLYRIGFGTFFDR